MRSIRIALARREFLASLAAVAAFRPERLMANPKRKLDLIEARTNLGLRRGKDGKLPGTARASQVLIKHGLLEALPFRRRTVVEQLPYSDEAEPGTKLRNGRKIRAFNLELATAVARSIATRGFPLVVGGECSDLLGGLYGLRQAGGRGLVHIDGHSDFLQDSFYPPQFPLHSAAGMDLALATGRGDELLTQWPGISGALVDDADTYQFGERYSDHPEARIEEMAGSSISQMSIQRARSAGLASAAAEIVAMLEKRKITAAWLHVDTDVLDEAVMPAVDSPGTPGLSFAELAWLIGAIISSGRIAGADVAIYDPDLDPGERCAEQLVGCIRQGFGSSRSPG